MLATLALAIAITTGQKTVIQKPQLPLNIKPANTLWGFADLHCHPATHLGFGYDGSNNGIFWGKPGMALAGANATIASDLAPCPADSHSGFDLDPVRKGTRQQIIQGMDTPTAYEHGASGWPDFRDWPSALSVDHQQMHVLMLHRAYEGGLRLMVASVAENQMLNDLWHIGFNLFGNSVPKPDSNIEYQSAVRQLEFIRSLAAANSTWMQVVTTPEECKQAITANKLAVVLSLEMDSLSPQQMLTLVHNYGVREIIPIHLSNNSFGGTAAYGDLFNTNTDFLTGNFIQVQNDPLLSFRFSKPQTLQSWTFLGVIQPGDVNDAQYRALGYASGSGGERNVLGLNQSELLQLMRAGVIIDVAHMSQKATETALAMGQIFHYPMIDSHTAIRPSSEIAESERDLRYDDAQKIGALGGMVGLGTTGDQANIMLLNTSANPVIRFTGDIHDYVHNLTATGPHAADRALRVTVTIVTGGDDLRGGGNAGDNADLLITLRSGQVIRLNNINRGQNWGNNTAHAIQVPIPAGTRAIDVTKLQLHTGFGGGIGGDNWNVNQIQVAAVSVKEDMVQAFIDSCNEASPLLHGRIALGTDFNGLSPQLPFASQDIPYPFVPPASKLGTPALPAFRLGNRTFDFRRDGLAHYGMLADFMEAISRRPGSATAMGDLFSSANSFYEMWTATETAARNVH